MLSSIRSGLVSFWRTQIADPVARDKWIEWTVILVTVAGIIYASWAALQLVNDRLVNLDGSVAELRVVRPCSIQPDHEQSSSARERANLLACLEQDAVRKRYLFSALLVESRIWARYYACVAAFLLIAVGCIFIIMKVREDPHEIGGGTAGVSFNFKSTSPGLAMIVLGCAILTASLLSPGDVRTQDSPAYLSDAFVATNEQDAYDQNLVDALA